MDTPAKHDLAAICSVTEMAAQLGLSRARFYQLVERAVFPPPVRTGNRRPCYPPELQQKCLQVRQTRLGFNGRPVLFNRHRKSSKSRNTQGGQYGGLAAALKNMGLKVSANAVKHAVGVLYPAGPPGSQSQDQVLRDLFRHFTKDCQHRV